MSDVSVSIQTIIEALHLHQFNPEVDATKSKIMIPDVSRPSLQLTGYFEHFDAERVQIIGKVEYTYLEYLDIERKHRVYQQLCSFDIPCIIFSRDMKPDSELLAVATENKVPVLGSDMATSLLEAELIYYLTEKLAPSISIHGVLVDVYGEGLLLMGESGVGKSEAALELIRRGHRLVSDDVVELRKMNEHTLVGSSPEITRHFIELRGIGIIDVKTLFGVECVKNNMKIDLVIRLEDWKKDSEYDRLGLTEEHVEFLGNQVISHSIPIRPGRNLAVICETAAVNHRQKKMGYNAAKELYTRVQENMNKKGDDKEE